MIDVHSDPQDESILQGIFREVDTNGNGRLERDEVEKALQALSGLKVEPEALDALFLASDRDEDGSIDFGAAASFHPVFSLRPMSCLCCPAPADVIDSVMCLICDPYSMTCPPSFTH